MKMSELFNCYFTGGKPAMHEKPLSEIYASTNIDDAREIRPVLWLYRTDLEPRLFCVDYIGEGLGCTLAAFDSLTDAQEYREAVAGMDADEFNARFLAGELSPAKLKEV